MDKYKFIKKLTLFSSVEAIYLYGSRATGSQRKTSDIDIAILCPTATTKEWHEILETVENAHTLLSIDCVRYDQVKDIEFKERINKEKRVLYEKQ